MPTDQLLIIIGLPLIVNTMFTCAMIFLINSRISDLREEMNTRFTNLEKLMDQRFDSLERELHSHRHEDAQ
jgi:hypothetical protein